MARRVGCPESIAVTIKRLVWFRRDLRLKDNPIWTAGHGAEVRPVFVLDPMLLSSSPARRHHLLAGLEDLDRRIQQRGGRLQLVPGDPVQVIPAIAARFGAQEVHVNEDSSPYGRDRDRAVGERVRLIEHSGNYVHPLGAVATRAGRPYRVFSSFMEAWSDLPVPDLRPEPDLVLTNDPGVGVPEHKRLASAGETAALERISGFDASVDRYAESRDRPGQGSTSNLSVDLKFGWLGAALAARTIGTGTPGRLEWTRQLAWRDFFANLLAVTPQMLHQTLRPSMKFMRWRDDAAGLDAWKTGMTGFPLVDAGMRQLAAEGWMPNRVRMVTASFLVKDLLIDWRLGERHFRRLLLDGDPAQNSGNWQWVAGTGHAAAPWFRILNPTVQARKYDPDGSYVRRWLPELEGVAVPSLHHPGADGLGDGYPRPLVEHESAVARYQTAVRDALVRYESN